MSEVEVPTAIALLAPAAGTPEVIATETAFKSALAAVSYTHLTLPTKRIV